MRSTSSAWRLATKPRPAVALAVAGIAVAGCVATQSEGAPNTSRPPAVHSRLLRAASGELARGTPVSQDRVSARALSTIQVGYALATVEGHVYPAVTTNGAKGWRIDGPAFEDAGAQGAVAVSAVAPGQGGEAAAWGGLVPNTAVDATVDGGKQWWQAFLPGDVLYVGADGRSIVANVYGTIREAGESKTGLWAYTTRNGRTWTYSYELT